MDDGLEKTNPSAKRLPDIRKDTICEVLMIDGLTKDPSFSSRLSGESWGGGHACGVGRIHFAWRGSHALGVTANCKKTRRDCLRGHYNG